MELITASLTHPGGREHNEDSCGYEALPDGGGCWCIADGLGGHGGGEVASAIATQAVLESFRAAPAATPAALGDYIERAQQALLRRQQDTPELAAMRTTIVVLTIADGEAIWAHVGDTRLYRFRAGRIVSQTRDHSVPQVLADAGDIAVDDIRHHEDRNRLLRTLGNPGSLRPAIEAASHPVRSGDAFLLCSDGFWEYVTETEMELCLARSAGPEEWLGRMVSYIRRRAPAKHDNYTGVAVCTDRP